MNHGNDTGLWSCYSDRKNRKSENVCKACSGGETTEQSKNTARCSHSTDSLTQKSQNTEKVFCPIKPKILCLA